MCDNRDPSDTVEEGAQPTAPTSTRKCIVCGGPLTSDDPTCAGCRVGAGQGHTHATNLAT